MEMNKDRVYGMRILKAPSSKIQRYSRRLYAEKVGLLTGEGYKSTDNSSVARLQDENEV